MPSSNRSSSTSSSSSSSSSSSGFGGGSPMVSKKAPSFKAESLMPDGSFKTVSLKDYKNKKYVLLYFYPADFTFVCPSEILAFDKAVKDFESRDVQLIGCSVDSVFAHLAWSQTPREKGGIGKINHPLMADSTKKIAERYNVLNNDGIAFRGLFLIDKKGVLRHMIVNDLPLGRSVDEALRMIDALQFFEQHGEVCPANWKKGAKGMKATNEGVIEYLKSLKS